jgi:hypothetical protein
VRLVSFWKVDHARTPTDRATLRSWIDMYIDITYFLYVNLEYVSKTVTYCNARMFALEQTSWTTWTTGSHSIILTLTVPACSTRDDDRVRISTVRTKRTMHIAYGIAYSIPWQRSIPVVHSILLFLVRHCLCLLILLLLLLLHTIGRRSVASRQVKSSQVSRGRTERSNKDPWAKILSLRSRTLG